MGLFINLSVNIMDYQILIQMVLKYFDNCTTFNYNGTIEFALKVVLSSTPVKIFENQIRDSNLKNITFYENI